GGGGGASQGSVQVGNAGANTLVVAGGVAILDGSDSFQSVTLGLGGVLDLVGPASIAQPVTIVSGSTVITDAADALDNIALDPTIAGTLDVEAPITLPSDSILTGTVLLEDRLQLPSLTVRPNAIVSLASANS